MYPGASPAPNSHHDIMSATMTIPIPGGGGGGGRNPAEPSKVKGTFTLKRDINIVEPLHVLKPAEAAAEEVLVVHISKRPARSYRNNTGLKTFRQGTYEAAKTAASLLIGHSPIGIDVWMKKVGSPQATPEQNT